MTIHAHAMKRAQIQYKMRYSVLKWSQWELMSETVFGIQIGFSTTKSCKNVKIGKVLSFNCNEFQDMCSRDEGTKRIQKASHEIIHFDPAPFSTVNFIWQP